MNVRKLTAASVTALVGGLALGLGATAATAASDATTVNATVNTKLAVTAPESIDFGALEVGGPAVAQNALVNVVSNVRGGYTFSAARTLFAPDDLNLVVNSATAPAGVTVASPGAIPTSGSLALGARTGSITAATGDDWNIDLGLSAPAETQDGAHQATVTFTAVGI